VVYKVLITFNYKEGTQTVTSGEATEAASEENGSDLDCFTAVEKGMTFAFTIQKQE
jgi:site-specific DNA recombinase